MAAGGGATDRDRLRVKLGKGTSGVRDDTRRGVRGQAPPGTFRHRGELVGRACESGAAPTVAVESLSR